ncbi:hypothetical protein IAQ61_009017 [Plenodomus lingam]|uniref:Similar to YeeE/YedE family integral membrane protein n=1 Tax=Leptosphaeria maculans (strain JN3 / isolate v23.1.3 / race Av1-4-5-6-7-8) TaxID=985895 RepID=E4ZNT7_LEPMJ|nr:similar to YeeE/YedE family integral membrane protein [Plenodomus lingam JN3]KAH9865071.1 hypothetical protein IAQ61_009017 [Plenodomus lingam]CBX93306.1 similar to YeeE/YedE family integral membrane protein [Plenodomus lingam JN3]
MFTPVETTIGALLLHQSTSNLLYQNGDILGASGLLRRIFSGPTKELVAFFAGMALSYIPLHAMAPQLATAYPSVTLTPQVAIATFGLGAIVGWGTKMSNGCTSGHMLCGLSRLSGRSTVAVVTFFPVAIITHHLAHPTLRTSACPGNIPCYTPVYPSPANAASLLVLTALSILSARTIPGLVARLTSPSQKENNGKAPPTNTLSAPRIATNFFSGLLFALGLHISGMSHPAKVTSFLSFPVLDQWDPSLALIILFGVLPNLVENQIRGFASPPKFANQFSLPTKTLKDIDAKFVLGAAAFGIGWGLSGTCPGPAVLRAVVQPVWGALWMTGFWVGGRILS